MGTCVKCGTELPLELLEPDGFSRFICLDGYACADRKYDQLEGWPRSAGTE